MTEKILEMLKQGGYVSGSDISRELGISRNAVWKHICKLKKSGYDIDSVTNKGYLLNQSDSISKESVLSHLNTEFIGRNLIIYDEISSTNTAASENSTMPNGTVFLARAQTSGRGRLGRAWQSGRSGMWFSILLKPHIPPESVSAVTLIAGLAVRDAIGADSMIKWPNDIVIDGKKVCGILTELSAEIDRVNHVICGIGINLSAHSFPPELEKRATSLKLCKIEYDANILLAKILNKFETYYNCFLTSGFSPFISEYSEKCINIGREVSFTYKNERFTATAVGISENGALIADIDGKHTEISSGEVTLGGYGDEIMTKKYTKKI